MVEVFKVMTVEMETLSYYCIKLTERKSFAWRYFGVLVKAEDYEQCIDNDHVYCSVCFQANLPNTPTSANNVVTLVKRYKKNVATGNLLLHLRKNHNITPPTEAVAESSKIVDLFSHLKGTNSSNKISNKASKLGETSRANKNTDGVKINQKGRSKNAVCRDLTLWFCRDILSFHLTNNQGFTEFAKKYKISGGNELPEPQSIFKYAFSDVYETTISVITKAIASSPKVLSMTMDTWTDMFKQLSFISFTLHFVGNSFITKSFMLRTCVIPHPYVIQNIQNEIKKTIEQFGLKNKIVICVNPEGSNVSKACALNKTDSYNCVSYALHNLVVYDGIYNTPDVKKLIIKARQIIQHLSFKMMDLPREYYMQYRESLFKLMEISELLDADAQLPILEQPSPSQMNINNTLQDSPTRWTCILSLMGCLTQNEAAIIQFLNILEMCEFIPTESEWSLMKEIYEVLGTISTASEVLSGCRFASLNLALLFRAELLSNLRPVIVDSQTIFSFKENMLNAVERRFPVSELQLCAALLDPSLRGLQVTDEYLYQNNSSREAFLKKMFEAYISPDLEENLCESAAVTPSEEQQPSGWKRLKLELLQKHTGGQRIGIEAEIQQYLSVTTAIEDPLLWWKDHENSFPRLACLAKYILCIPATSIPSERAFNKSEVLWNAKKLSVSPAKLDRILFIHENHDLIQLIV